MVGNPFKLEFTLKQHTPLIHFQHKQANATLRATELKPKLDKFLIEKCPNDVEQFIRKTSDGKHSYLDYKVSVLASKGVGYYVSLDEGVPNTTYRGYSKLNVSSFFGNTGLKTDNDARCAVLTKEDVLVSIICLNPKLKDVIRAKFESFLSVTNFGMRQNKGFGSFYIQGKSIADLKKKYKYFTIKSSNYETVLNDINLFYRCLRSGINQKDKDGDVYYFKSLMFMYAKSKNFTWDKRTLRESFYLDNRSYNQVKLNRVDSDGTVHWESAKPTKYLFRDLLGLSSEQNWLSYSDILTKEDKNKDDEDNGIIQRFKSPITFKPIKEGACFVVFIILEEVPSEYLSSYFIVKSRNNTSKSVELQLYDKFSLEDFLTFCIKIDIDSHIQVSSKRTNSEIDTIKAIFSELQKQL